MRLFPSLALAVMALPATASAQIAVVTGRTTPLAALSLDDLKRLYSGKAVSVGGQHVTVAEYTKLRESFYRAVLKIPESEARRRWVAVAFRGEAMVPPEMSDPAEVKRWVGDHPGGIAFLDLESVDASVKVLAIDDKKPSDASYPLK